MTSPLLSVIIPCFNHGEYLQECCASVIAQRYESYEIIIIDDGSTDPVTHAVYETLSLPNITILRTKNQGCAAARNKGIRIARGKYILPLDADDKIGTGYLEKAVRLLETEPDLGIVYCRGKSFGAQEGEWFLPFFSLKRMLRRNLIFCSAVYRKEDWLACGGYREEMQIGLEDYDFWLSLLGMGRSVKRINEVLFFYRKHTQTSRSMAMLKSQEKTLHAYLQILQNHFPLYEQYPECIAPLLTRKKNASLFAPLIRLMICCVPLQAWRKRLRVEFLEL